MCKSYISFSFKILTDQKDGFFYIFAFKSWYIYYVFTYLFQVNFEKRNIYVGMYKNKNLYLSYFFLILILLLLIRFCDSKICYLFYLLQCYKIFYLILGCTNYLEVLNRILKQKKLIGMKNEVSN